MTNAEAIAEAKRIEESIEARIAAGEIPPRPEGYDRDAHSTWFTKHLVCAEPTHRYFVRERGSRACSQCLGFKIPVPERSAHFVTFTKFDGGFAVVLDPGALNPKGGSFAAAQAHEQVRRDALSLTPAKQQRTPRKLR